MDFADSECSVVRVHRSESMRITPGEPQSESICK